MLQEMMRGLVVGAVGTTLRWFARMLRNGLIAFVVGGGVAFGISAATIWLVVGRVPDTTSWLLLGTIAVLVALLSAFGTMAVTVMRGLSRVGRGQSGTSSTAGPLPSATAPMRDNVRAFPTMRAKRRVS